MVSKASEDLPEPLSPVMTTSWSRGISTSMFFRLCARAPRTTMRSLAMECLLYVRHAGLTPEDRRRGPRGRRREHDGRVDTAHGARDEHTGADDGADRGRAGRRGGERGRRPQ